MANEQKKINLRMADGADKAINLSADSIPTLIPSETLALIQDGDTQPYYKVQAIDYPLKANGFNYTEGFFESYIAKMNRAPIPGSKDGHHLQLGKRSPTDFMLIGGKLDKNGDGSGVAYLKNYIPPVAESNNTNFIIENKANMVDYSLVAMTKDMKVNMPDGSIRMDVMESVIGERNDAVPYGLGAMEQKTNSREAENEEVTTVADEKKTLFEKLSTMKANAEISLMEIAKHLGLEAQLITDEQKTNLAAYDRAVKLTGDVSPEAFIAESIEKAKANAASVRSAKISEAFGPVEYEDSHEKNLSREYAESLLPDGEVTEEKINEIKGGDVFKKLAAERADYTSDANRAGKSEKTNAEDVSKTGVKVRKI